MHTLFTYLPVYLFTCLLMAGLIPQAFIDDLLNRVDIVDVVDKRVKLRKTGKNYSGLARYRQDQNSGQCATCVRPCPCGI
jgi:hypothetical protein